MPVVISVYMSLAQFLVRLCCLMRGHNVSKLGISCCTMSFWFSMITVLMRCTPSKMHSLGNSCAVAHISCASSSSIVLLGGVFML